MKKKIMLVSALAVLMTVGCSNNQTSQVSSSSNTSSVSSIDNGDIQYDENGNVIYQGVELNMWSVTTGDDATTQDSIIAKFNEMYDGMIKVNVTHQSRYELETLLTSTIQFDKKNAPDILFNHSARVSEYNTKEWLLPIEDYYEKGKVILDKDDYASSLLEATTINGKMYATPMDVHSAMVTIRVDILEKNNLKIPTNYTELVDVCEKATELAAAGNLYIRGTNSDGYTATEWRKATTAEAYHPFPIAYGDMWVHEFAGYTAAVQNGGILVKDGMPGWNSKETAAGLQVLRDWIFPSDTSSNKHAISMDYGSDYDVGIGPFSNGNAIFKLDGPWTYQSDLTKFERELSADGGSNNITTRSLASLFAKDSTKEYASKIKGEGHALMLMSTVSSYTKRCAAAVFADYLAYNSGIEWAKRGHIPAVNSVVLSNDYKNDPAYEKYIKYWLTPDDYVVYGPTDYYSYCDTYFKNALQKSMANSFLNKDISKILNDEYTDCIDYIELYA